MIDGQKLRAGMRAVPTAVTVVTTASNGRTRGATIGSFASVSLEPPLVCFNISRDAQLHEVLMDATRLVIHVLRDDQIELSNFFANKDRSSEEQLAQTPHAFDEHGVPILKDALAVFSCNLVSMSETGDSSLVVAHVDAVYSNEDGDPLVFYNRGYCRVGDRL
ncbi:MAG: flavin reductase family protein [Rhodothermales bacterium]|nr:flavin reductase family protein [Rhodothermales bacterium]